MLTDTNIKQVLAVAKNASKRAGKAIMDIYLSSTPVRAIRDGSQPVTIADKRSHEIIVQELEQTELPVLSEEGKIPVYEDRKYWDYFWLVDPLDGTKEFIKKNGEFTVCIALVHQNQPVLGVIYVPCTEVLYFSLEGEGVFKSQGNKTVQIHPLKGSATIRQLSNKEHVRIVVSRSHISAATNEYIKQFQHPEIMIMGSSLKFVMLVEGKADIYPRLDPTMEWDTAAGHALLNAMDRHVYEAISGKELVYNKPKLVNPSFIAF